MTRRYVFGMIAYLVTFALALVNLAASLILVVLLALLFVLTEPSGRAKIVRRSRQRR